MKHSLQHMKADSRECLKPASHHCPPFPIFHLLPYSGLLCLRPAKSGGLSRWASSTTIYNEVLATCPDLAPVLAGTWYWDRKNEVPAGKEPFFILPVLNFHEVGVLQG